MLPENTFPSLRVSAFMCYCVTTNVSARSGQTVSGSGRKFLTHIVLHSTRHWAQMAALMRQHGHKTDWQHDFIFSDAVK